ncbi:type II toxin-antitoxin system HipA family toxin [Pseudaquabacterium rugosum]|uniref:HipA domain-containing protein n=1 Tax=Pseudaquabacterium rugosum TaxID=2984194 RepID=A0ABU9BBE0_9BURK
MTTTPPPPIHAALHLWWLGDPACPVPVGELAGVPARRGVSLRYGEHWLRHGFALSEDLPLQPGEHLPQDEDGAPGAVGDAFPDGWGERLIRHLDGPAGLSPLEVLYRAGDERFGALGVSTSARVYRPHGQVPLPTLADVRQLAGLVDEVVPGLMPTSIPTPTPVPVPEPEPERTARPRAGESLSPLSRLIPLSPLQRRLITSGVGLGGSRPKALITLDGAPWLLKLNAPGERLDAQLDAPLVEHATLTLAALAGIAVAETRPIRLDSAGAIRHALAVRRFDRDRDGAWRRHALSAHVALRAAGEPAGYPELAQLLRRRGVAAAGLARAQMQELFRRMVFNILIGHTDDHARKHVLLMTDAGDLALSPAFGVRPAGQASDHQQMRVGRDGPAATLDNALSECTRFDLDRVQALAALRQVVAVVDGWQAHFAGQGVTAADIAQLAQQIDRPALRGQRAMWRRGSMR